MEGPVIFESEDERASRTLEQNARPALLESGFELQTVGAAPFSVDVAKKRMTAGVTARRSHERHQGRAFRAQMPQLSLFHKPSAMQANRRKHEITGGPPNFSQNAGCLHGSRPQNDPGSA
jgi:hypothetical protein